MNPSTRKIVLSAVATVASLSFLTHPAAAHQAHKLLIPPGHDHCLPELGFSSLNIRGVGERVTFVRWGGHASRLGLEPGDLIVRLNGFPLTYHGAWNDALSSAVANGGWVRLTIRDVRTGRLVARSTFVGGGGVGPVTPKFHAGYGPHESHVIHHPHQVGYPVGPGHGHSYGASDTLKKLAKLFD